MVIFSKMILNESQLVPYEAVSPPQGPYLVFAPHPDDETLGMGGTIALAVAGGIDVYVVFVTNGDKGGDADVRKDEAGAAVNVLGVKKAYYLNLHDREVFNERLPGKCLNDIFDSVGPSTVFLPSFQEVHPDHRAVTRKMLSFISRNSTLDIAMKGFELWFYEINRQGEINRLVDITAVLEIKQRAIDCYGSQLSVLDYKAQALCMDLARSITLGERCQYAEGFWRHDGEQALSPEQCYLDRIAMYRHEKPCSVPPYSFFSVCCSKSKEMVAGLLPKLKIILQKGMSKSIPLGRIVRDHKEYQGKIKGDVPVSENAFSYTPDIIILLPLKEFGGHKDSTKVGSISSPVSPNGDSAGGKIVETGFHEELFLETVNSIIKQTYAHWQLILYCPLLDENPASSFVFEKAFQSYFKKNRDILESDARINLMTEPLNGPGNDVDVFIKKSSGDFVLLMDAYDTLSVNALAEAVDCLNKAPGTDFLYTDEDKIALSGDSFDPFFKPDWSPDLLMSCMYTGRLSLYRKCFFLEAGGFFSYFNNDCGEYNLALRVMELTDKIRHIPKLLYHRRDIPKPSADLVNKSAFDKYGAEKALLLALERRGVEGAVSEGLTPYSFRVSMKIPRSYRVTIIIPFKDKVEVLETCVNSVLHRTSFDAYDILCVNNQSREKETHAWMERMGDIERIHFLDYDKPFNFSALNNFAVARASGEMLLFLNSDTEVISPHWLEAMLEHACKPDVGAVGARLYYPNDTLQHAGILLGNVAGLAGHAFKHISRFESDYYFGLPSVVRNVSGVTAACMMVKRNVFDETGGFDEKYFKITYNDVDFCLKLRDKGYKIIYTPFAELYHHESYSRGYAFDNLAAEQLRKKWKSFIEYDPFYNENLTTLKEDWTLPEENPESGN